MNNWIKAFWFDLIGQEDKSPLDSEDRINYSLYFGCIFMVFGIVGLFIHWLMALIGFGIGARKFQIYFNKKKKYEAMRKNHENT